MMISKKMRLLILAAFMSLSACASQVLNDGKQNFDNGNYQQAMEKLKPLAEKGNPQAQYAVGYMYYYGQGVSPDKEVGLDWIDKAAAQGSPEALSAQQAIQKQETLNPLKTN
jgi:TPR repeat protein